MSTLITPFATGCVLNPEQGGTGIDIMSTTIDKGELLGGIGGNVLGLIALIAGTGVTINTATPGQITLSFNAVSAGALLAANNLSDVASAVTSRSNLGLGTAATLNQADVLLALNNLSDLTSPVTARANLGLGTAALLAAAAVLQAANNLSDVANAATARTNLGLGSIATQAASNVTITGGSIALNNPVVGNFFVPTPQAANATTGGNVTVANNTGVLVVTNATGAAVTNYAVTMPAAPVDMQPLEIAVVSNATVNTVGLVLTANTGQTINAGQATTAVNVNFGSASGPFGVLLRYVAASSMWSIVTVR